MTQLTDKEHEAQMAAMKSFDQQMPCGGRFPEVAWHVNTYFELVYNYHWDIGHGCSGVMLKNTQAPPLEEGGKSAISLRRKKLREFFANS